MDGSGEAIALGTLLARLAGELDEAAAGCLTVQAAISTLLDRADHPDLGEDIHMLQDVDRLQQTLRALAGVLALAAAAAPDTPVQRSDIARSTRLASLAERLFPARSAAPARKTGPRPAAPGITWF
ncbi:hypothetical protein [Sinisalibacter aestuarii]|uniref:Uncharacterized protein n=1 Tax=Sinisalibacter aestuarii TaxID=2949426 RepID=A0ABQ5LTG4_9RHOB|nr:hypothetical protein [Sinisalibacter aestuarii]GKY87700.1 hypothetical protein STA1M1_15690 [Sinisalibacter aestuarii]